MIDADTVRRHTVEVARRLDADEPAVTANITEQIRERIDRLDEDPILSDMLAASVHGNVTTMIHVLLNGIPLDHLQPTTAAVEYALRLAQRDVPANSLVRAYHTGQSILLRDVYRMVGELGLDTDESTEVIRHISDTVYLYIDWISLYVFQTYEDERQRWMGVASHVVTSAIHTLLDAADPDPRPFERDVGYRLDRRHTGLILWAVDDAVTVRELDRAARAVASKVKAVGEPLVTAIDRTTVWVWIPTAERTAPVESDDVAVGLGTHPGIRASVGLTAAGLPGFRRTHRQAQAAFAVATGADSGATDDVVGYGDRGIAVVSLLAHDLDATRDWVRDVLGDLAGPGETAQVLRETLTVYYEEGDSHVRAAERLNVHRNTVKYRVSKALADAPDVARLDRALALTVCEFLGSAVIG